MIYVQQQKLMLLLNELELLLLINPRHQPRLVLVGLFEFFSSLPKKKGEYISGYIQLESVRFYSPPLLVCWKELQSFASLGFARGF